MEAFINTAVDIFGDVHGIINNAGIIRDGLLVKKDRNTGETVFFPIKNGNRFLMSI